MTARKVYQPNHCEGYVRGDSEPYQTYDFFSHVKRSFDGAQIMRHQASGWHTAGNPEDRAHERQRYRRQGVFQARAANFSSGGEAPGYGRLCSH